MQAGRSGCYNIDCSGFMQVGGEKILGNVESHVFAIEADEKIALVTTIKQLSHWRLCIKIKQKCAGYWPKELFPRLSLRASIIRFDGETYTPLGMDSPPMDSGRLPQEKYINSGFMSNIRIINSEYNEIDIHPENMKINKGGNLNCYLVYRGYEGRYAHQAFLSSGPGGKSC
ncbi:protein neprosin-like [Vicia villosa]|uniref:protein neprosin-like n=1 Tax=Vicia villosa TaxID=3911 RepID=UPI00273C271F|nr:protein neprosin-like [Vicia villosa]